MAEAEEEDEEIIGSSTLPPGEALPPRGYIDDMVDATD